MSARWRNRIFDMNITKIIPQEGFQMDFLRSSADIVIGGGAAGAGKSYALLIEPLRHISNKGFAAAFFRRTYAQIKMQGGLWDTSMLLYPGLNARPNSSEMKWTFNSKSDIKFYHLQYEADILNHQGAQYTFIAFDELTHFTEKQFFYLLSRNRSVSGIKPYIRATCNPDPDSWVANLIDWWIDQDTGFPIVERCGKLRYFVKIKDNLVWGNTKDEVLKKAPEIIQYAELANTSPDNMVKSLTFIPGSIYGNKELLKQNPEYLANLLSQDEATKAQLLEGNWKIKIDGAALFEYTKLNDLWSNYTDYSKTKCITTDPARFGRDFCVIMVWDGWVVVRIMVFYKSEAHEIVDAIEKCRATFGIGKSSVLVDQDGVGDGTVKLGGYVGFHGGAPAVAEPETNIKEAYKNLKTQCYYRFSKRVNENLVKITISAETVIVAGVRSTQLKVAGKVVDIRTLIIEDLKAIKRDKIDLEGKKQINSKEQQKILLHGRSPDFGDTLMMREWFELSHGVGTSKARSY